MLGKFFDWLGQSNDESAGIKSANSNWESSLLQFLKLVPQENRETIKSILIVEIERCFKIKEPYFYSSALNPAYSGVLNQTPISACTEDYKLVLTKAILFMFFKLAYENGYIPSFRYSSQKTENEDAEYLIELDIGGDWTGKISIVRNTNKYGFERIINLSTTSKLDYIKEDIIDTDEFFNNEVEIAVHNDFVDYIPECRLINSGSSNSKFFDTIQRNMEDLKNRSGKHRDAINSQEQEELVNNLGNAIIDADLCPRQKISFGGSYSSFSIVAHTFFISYYFVDKSQMRYALLVVRDSREYLKYLIRWDASSELWQIQDVDGKYIRLPYPLQVYLTGLQALNSKNQTVKLAQERLVTQSKNLLNRVPNLTNAPKIPRKLYLDGKKGADRPNWKWGIGYPIQNPKYGNGDSETIIAPSLKGDIFYTFKSTGELIKVEPFLALGDKDSISSWLHQQFKIEIADQKALEKLFANRQ
jgi:hypothetical protein